ncbi:MAG: MtrB/PioB family outer membrane beta-barrel protein [Muribaculaceae bacterium]|nr:MtrB/PioB family outer membrane beta-barrel protein [Muribaculaceae bacterium]
MNRLTKLVGMSCLAALLTVPTWGQVPDDEHPNQLTIDASIMARGELRFGGLRDEGGIKDDDARFILERTRLGIDYARKWLEVRISAQHSGVWGQQGKGSINLYETWAKLTARNGLFAQVGRQELNYDDERILGRNDWAMAANTHDALRLGYEGHGHKVHVIGAYNQKSESTNGGTTYTTTSGAYPHKSLLAAWYHFDFPRWPLGVSVTFMNVGMQSPFDENPTTQFQQLLGGYVTFKPHRWSIEASYYRQMGKDEFKTPISAWMAALKANYTPHEQWRITAGYDYLSGDNNPVVPMPGTIGLARHTKVQGFSTVYGSHHKFYGAMDFFYLSAFYGGYTPGLQNFYIGARYAPIKPLTLDASYHYLATASKVSEADRSLGNELEFSVSYAIMKEVKLSAGYSYMNGTSTLQRLQRSEGKSRLHWAWLMLTVNPRIFSIKW